ncbi:hypothetical protein IE53DRAFT_246010 [Violaceomyces palustris]|uniref:Uncharacterized protein n=1 Tax=Violaceomyces palustris TaxID=1673888 RepID=A0ACD0NNW3_9BASI|nr:hypothetical protein IE53DRAFT_246010 [Violaceomyces palustris]
MSDCKNSDHPPAGGFETGARFRHTSLCRTRSVQVGPPNPPPLLVISSHRVGFPFSLASSTRSLISFISPNPPHRQSLSHARRQMAYSSPPPSSSP